MRYFFHLAYKGTNYRGWQRQPQQVNVQEVVENALSQISKTPIFITGCGRTDAGVHASQFFFHLDVTEPWRFDVVSRLNKTLPPDIAVFECLLVEPQQHARHSATQRTYDYFVHTSKNPFLHEVSALYEERNLRLADMQRAVSLLTRYTDFLAFCKTPADYKHTTCRLSSATLFADREGSRLRLQLSADRFLRSMVRVIAGKLIEVGRGKLSVDELEDHLASGKAFRALLPAHPQGLFLSKVSYPFLDLPNHGELFPQNVAVVWAAV